MGLFAVDPFVGPAERAQGGFNMPYQRKGDAGLTAAGLPADGTTLAHARKGAIKRGGGGGHGYSRVGYV